MNKTAEQFARRPADAYLEAYKGEVVIINHDRYPDKVFELTARDRRSMNRFPQTTDEDGNPILTWVSPFPKADTLITKNTIEVFTVIEASGFECLKDSFI